MNKRVMFFFPYVGASSLTFQKWKSIFSPEIECVILDYPGHGTDEEELSNDLKVIADKMYRKVIAYLDDGDEYYLCGHCIGALVAFEVFKLLKEKCTKTMPNALFLCSQVAPDKNKSDGLLNMDDDELCEYLLKNNLIAEVVLQDDMKEYLEGIILAPIRNDEYAADNYKTEFPVKKYDSQVFVCYGEQDEEVSVDIKSWEKYFNEVEYIQFEGAHYFPWDDEELFADEIKDALDL